MYLDFINVSRLLNGVTLPREEVLREGVQDVCAEDDVITDLAGGHFGVLNYRDIHVHNLELVRPRNLQRRFQDVQKFGQAFERHVHPSE